MRLEWLIGEYRDVRHQLLPDRTGHMVRVELRLAPFLVVWCAQSIAVRLDQERNALLETHVDELVCRPRRRQSDDCVRELRAIAEDVVTDERVLPHEMPNAPSAEPFLHSHSCYLVQKAFEVRDECEVSLPVE